MASKLSFSLFLLLLTTTTAVVSARPGIPFHPCNTLIISTFSFSIPRNPNPNPNSELIFLDFRPIHRLPLPLHHHHIFRQPRLDRLDRISADIRHPQRTDNEITDLPLGFSSIRERTKDILSVVASLLFGAACGALTAGTMYLIWALFNHRSVNYRSLDGFASSDDDDDDDDDVFNPKKSHYVAMPASPVKEKKIDGFVAADVKKDGADAVAVEVVVKEAV